MNSDIPHVRINPDATEVLARLLALNKERAEQERLAGSKAAAIPTRSSRKRRGTPGPNLPGIS
jgi:hypothetical protein